MKHCTPSILRLAADFQACGSVANYVSVKARQRCIVDSYWKKYGVKLEGFMGGVAQHPGRGLKFAAPPLGWLEVFDLHQQIVACGSCGLCLSLLAALCADKIGRNDLVLERR